jgi:hypothetical protein
MTKPKMRQRDLRVFLQFTGLTREQVAQMTHAELAALAAKAPAGFTPVKTEAGDFMYLADWLLEELLPAERAKLTIVSRAH